MAVTAGRRLNVPLALAGAGAVLVLLPFLGNILQLVGVVAIVIGAVFTAPPPSTAAVPRSPASPGGASSRWAP